MAPQALVVRMLRPAVVMGRFYAAERRLSGFSGLGDLK